MHLEIRQLNLEPSDALRSFAQRQVERALRPFQESVQRVDIRIEDVNGPRGGMDKRCSVTVELTATKRKVVIKSTSTDAYGAVQAACGRIGESVSRALTRRRRLDRFSERSSPHASSDNASSDNASSDNASSDNAPSDNAASAPATQPLASLATKPAAENRIQVTALDHQRLQSLIDSWPSARDRDAADTLADELDRAEVLPAERISGDVVTMNSRVQFEDQETGETREVSLVYPQDSDVANGRISILAPVGSALLGLSIGQTIDWPLPRGQVKRLRIVDVVYQPEKAGDLHL